MFLCIILIQQQENQRGIMITQKMKDELELLDLSGEEDFTLEETNDFVQKLIDREGGYYEGNTN